MTEFALMVVSGSEKLFNYNYRSFFRAPQMICSLLVHVCSKQVFLYATISFLVQVHESLYSGRNKLVMLQRPVIQLFSNSGGLWLIIFYVLERALQSSKSGKPLYK